MFKPLCVLEGTLNLRLCVTQWMFIVQKFSYCLCVKTSTTYARCTFCQMYLCLQFPVSSEDERVQDLLARMTGMDFEKVFAPKKEPLKLPKYKLMSMEELEEVSFTHHHCSQLY